MTLPQMTPEVSNIGQRANSGVSAEVDILVVSYNTKSELRDCIRSLEASLAGALYGKLGVRVLDNGSSDGSAAMVESYFPSVKLTKSPENLFYGPAINALARRSTAQYLVLLNPDTVVVSDIVSPMLEALRSDERVALSFPSLAYLSGETQPCCQRFPTLAFELATLCSGNALARKFQPLWHPEEVLRRAFAPPPGQVAFPMRFIWSTCCMIRRRDALALGPFREAFPMYDADLDLCRRLSDTGRTAVFLPDHTVYHLGGASSSLEQRLRMMSVGRQKYYRDHGAWWAPTVFSLLQLSHRVIRRRHAIVRGLGYRQ